MIRASIYGRLGADPVERETRNGKEMVTVSLAVNAGRPDVVEETHTSVSDDPTSLTTLCSTGSLATQRASSSSSSRWICEKRPSSRKTGVGRSVSLGRPGILSE